MAQVVSYRVNVTEELYEVRGAGLRMRWHSQASVFDIVNSMQRLGPSGISSNGRHSSYLLYDFNF